MDLRNNNVHCLPNSVDVLIVMPEIDVGVETINKCVHVHTHDIIVSVVEIENSSVEEDGDHSGLALRDLGYGEWMCDNHQP
ncbi:hypothetical protein SESBI_10085 [Sesbania bispinosa]|nr:hypothetical protein SESBI_10085 [Sesbania bispinosa]